MIALLMFIVAAAAPVITPEPSGEGLDVIGGFDIRSSSIDYNYSNGDYTIPTRFTATNGGTDITADRAQGNSKHKRIIANGNVVIHQTRPSSQPGSATSHFTRGPSTLTCDHIDGDGTTRNYVVTGHVHFLQAGRDVIADRGTFDDATNQVRMEGHVVIKDQGQVLNADEVEYNTQSGDGKASGNVMVVSPISTPAPAQPATGPRKGRH